MNKGNLVTFKANQDYFFGLVGSTVENIFETFCTMFGMPQNVGLLVAKNNTEKTIFNVCEKDYVVKENDSISFVEPAKEMESIELKEIHLDSEEIKVLQDVRSHLIYCLLLIKGFFNEHDDTKGNVKEKEKFRIKWFFHCVLECENLVDDFLNKREIKQDYYDILLMAIVSYSSVVFKKKVKNMNYGENIMMIRDKITPRVDLFQRIKSFEYWIKCNNYPKELLDVMAFNKRMKISE